jgi:predicted signal transduction protein with EAL and GGDEF domain
MQGGGLSNDHSFNLNDDTFRISIKIGIAIFPDDGDNVDTLIYERRGCTQKSQAEC